MSVKTCFWAKFREICETPDECDIGILPSACIWCGWDADAEWYKCEESQSEIAKFVDEIIAGEEANNDPNWLPPS